MKHKVTQSKVQISDIEFNLILHLHECLKTFICINGFNLLALNVLNDLKLNACSVLIIIIFIHIFRRIRCTINVHTQHDPFSMMSDNFSSIEILRFIMATF